MQLALFFICVLLFFVLLVLQMAYYAIYAVVFVIFAIFYAPFWLVHQLHDLSVAHPYIAVPIWTWLTLRTSIALYLKYREQIRAVPKEAYLAFVVPMLVGLPVGAVWYCRHLFSNASF